jgi:cell division initiation protein
MQLTPLDIKKQEFKRSMRGYDIEEVNSFLELVSNQFENLQSTLRKFQENEMLLKKELDNYQNVEHTLRSTLTKLQESSEQSRENSQKEAELIIREAEVRGTEIIEKAKTNEGKIRSEITVLKTQRESLIKRLRHLLTSHLELIHMLEIDEDVVAASAPKSTPARATAEVPPAAAAGTTPDKAAALSEIDKIIANLEKQKRKNF